MMSPFSVAMALSFLSQATNGRSFEEIKKALYLNTHKATIANQFHDYYKMIQKSAGDSKITIVNQIYVQQGYQLQESLQRLASENFFSGIESVDFKKANDTAEIINKFVKKRTDGEILEIVKPDEFDEQTSVILINTVHFKSLWKYPFSKKNTRQSLFGNLSPRELSFPYFMSTKGYFMRTFVHELGANALMMDYKNSNWSMIILDPKGVAFLTVEERLKNYTLLQVVNQMTECYCLVSLPKFKIETEFDLNDILKNVCIQF